jgi:murein DD-endopeptidase MepM/ murein hydrolase activator NlpD
MNTISDDIRLAGVGGRPSLDQMVTNWLEDPEVRKADALEMKFSTLLRQIHLQDSTFSRMVSHVSMQFDRWSQMPSIWPCRGRITSPFGYRFHPFMGGLVFHEGIDIANAVWTPIFATADGIVTSVGYRGNYGTSVFISHRGSGYSTVYAHLEQTGVVEGQVLKRGELVGYLGNSGRTTGPHLHYEVRNNEKFEDPMKYILPMDIIVD